MLNFNHHYYKLDKEEFTTIRGKSRFGDFAIGEEFPITLNRKIISNVVLEKKELIMIKDLSLDFLKNDGEYEGFTIDSHEGFVDLLNTFRKPFYAQATVDSEVTIFYLRKVNI